MEKRTETALSTSSSSTSSSTITSGANFQEPEEDNESLQSLETESGSKESSIFSQLRSQQTQSSCEPSGLKASTSGKVCPTSSSSSSPLTTAPTVTTTSSTPHRYALQDFSPHHSVCKGHLNRHRNSHNHNPNTITCRPISETSSVAQLSLSSSSSSLESDPLSPACKICHLNAKEGDPLISPCKCAGTMQYIHCGCLMV